ncbi:hypothetical protein G7Y89_g8548 [Cudoniella acicularis]|uniref:non-specific serine/threonine protein kinase n=1 Tax=Cudoniella acicularis TaxID=354080 RepID=A0A8H4RIY5_9HELO|nr:hypothetical protein G7Y89_g8548 [Cudoniella acicularis]
MGRDDYEQVANGLVKGGTFGSVRPVIRKSDGKTLAWKRIEYDPKRYRSEEGFKEKVETEVALLKRFSHPNIVRYYDMDWEKGRANIYMEWCEGSNLDFYVSEHYNEKDWPSNREAWSIIYQLSAALAYCHHGILRAEEGRILREERDNLEHLWAPVLHRDIKALNVLVRHNPLGQCVVKLCDFGIGHEIRSPGDAENLSFGGTLPYLAPVRLSEMIPRCLAKTRCTFYYFFKRFTPYPYQITNAPSTNVANLPKHVSPTIVELIMSCIDYNQKDRPDAETLFNLALKHVDKSDRVLASVQTSSQTISDIGPSTPSPQRPEQSDKDHMPKSPNESAQAPQQSVDAFYSLQGGPATQPTAQSAPLPDVAPNPLLPVTDGGALNAPNTFANTTTKHRNDLALDFSSSRITTHEIGTGDIYPEIMEGLGSLVVDFQRYPPMDTKVWGAHKEITRVNLNRETKFQSKYETMVAPQKRRFFPSSRSESKTQVSVTIEADACDEYILKSSEDYLYGIMRDQDCREWFERKRAQKKAVYLVVGYIVYVNARVTQTSAGQGNSELVSAGSITGVNVPSVSASLTPKASIWSSTASIGSNAIDSIYEKRGPQVQAAYVQEVRMLKSGPSLGDMTTVFFWGPQSRPI